MSSPEVRIISSRRTVEAIELGPLTGYIGYQVRQAQSSIFRDLTGTLRPVGITPGEFSLLMLLELNPDLSPGALATRFQIDKATLSLALARLARRKLVRTARSAADRRYLTVSLTPLGRRALERARDCVARQERAMEAALRPGERERLLVLLRRISAVFRD